MRYLKVIAQDRGGKGLPDSLHFRFHENEQMQREATPAELRQLKSLGVTYLKCAWFNAGEHEERHLRMFSPTPGSVRLHFHDGQTVVYKAAAHDLDRDGVFEVILSSDVDNDGRANRTDRNRVRALVREFLKFVPTLDLHLVTDGCSSTKPCGSGLAREEASADTINHRSGH